MKREIETRLERSLRSQVRAPRLDGRFDAAVWARIEAAAAPARIPAASRWLLASNFIGVLVTIVLVAVVVTRAFTGATVEVELPQVAVEPGLVERVVISLVWPVTVIVLFFALMYTRLGRRLRAEWF